MSFATFAPHAFTTMAISLMRMHNFLSVEGLPTKSIESIFFPAGHNLLATLTRSYSKEDHFKMLPSSEFEYEFRLILYNPV